MQQHSSRALVRRIASLAGAAALAASLVACAGEPEPTPTPTPDANAPVFKTDEEAFAAAEDVYGEYVAVAEAVNGDGGENPERLEEIAFGQALEHGLATAQTFREQGRRVTGSIVPTFQPIQYFEDPERGAVVQIQVCEDISATDVLNAEGVSVVKDGRVEVVPYQVLIEGPTVEDLKVSERWLGRGSC